VSEDSSVVILKGFDHAVVGFAQRCGWSEPVIVYDRDVVISTLVDSGMNEDKALKYYNENIMGVDWGDGSPVFIQINPVVEH
jgi:hypothetical protein